MLPDILQVPVPQNSELLWLSAGLSMLSTTPGTACFFSAHYCREVPHGIEEHFSSLFFFSSREHPNLRIRQPQNQLRSSHLSYLFRFDTVCVSVAHVIEGTLSPTATAIITFPKHAAVNAIALCIQLLLPYRLYKCLCQMPEKGVRANVYASELLCGHLLPLWRITDAHTLVN